MSAHPAGRDGAQGAPATGGVRGDGHTDQGAGDGGLPNARH